MSGTDRARQQTAQQNGRSSATNATSQSATGRDTPALSTAQTGPASSRHTVEARPVSTYSSNDVYDRQAGPGAHHYGSHGQPAYGSPSAYGPSPGYGPQASYGPQAGYGYGYGYDTQAGYGAPADYGAQGYGQYHGQHHYGDPYYNGQHQYGDPYYTGGHHYDQGYQGAAFAGYGGYNSNPNVRRGAYSTTWQSTEYQQRQAAAQRRAADAAEASSGNWGAMQGSQAQKEPATRTCSKCNATLGPKDDFVCPSCRKLSRKEKERKKEQKKKEQKKKDDKKKEDNAAIDTGSRAATGQRDSSTRALVPGRPSKPRPCWKCASIEHDTFSCPLWNSQTRRARKAVHRKGTLLSRVDPAAIPWPASSRADEPVIVGSESDSDF